MSSDPAETVVQKLTTLGRPDESLWNDYGSMGVTMAHVPALIELATGRLVFETPEPASPAEEAAVWAPVHAWRALAELRAAEAAAPLTSLFARADAADDEWALEELPRVLAIIGEPALTPLEQCVNDVRLPEGARIPAAVTFEKLAARHPALRERCAAILAAALARLADNQPTLNGFIIGAMFDLKAREHFDVIEKAYKAGKVDQSICGKLADVRQELRLPPEPSVPSRPARKLMAPSVEIAINAALPKWNKLQPQDPLDSPLQ